MSSLVGSQVEKESQGLKSLMIFVFGAKPPVWHLESQGLEFWDTTGVPGRTGDGAAVIRGLPEVLIEAGADSFEAAGEAEETFGLHLSFLRRY
jgi:hypothetical protein